MLNAFELRRYKIIIAGVSGSEGGKVFLLNTVCVNVRPLTSYDFTALTMKGLIHAFEVCNNLLL